MTIIFIHFSYNNVINIATLIYIQVHNEARRCIHHTNHKITTFTNYLPLLILVTPAPKFSPASSNKDHN